MLFIPLNACTENCLQYKMNAIYGNGTKSATYWRKMPLIETMENYMKCIALLVQRLYQFDDEEL